MLTSRALQILGLSAAIVEVVVRNRGVGHFFPGGTLDAFDVWIEFKAPVRSVEETFLWVCWVCYCSGSCPPHR